MGQALATLTTPGCGQCCKRERLGRGLNSATLESGNGGYCAALLDGPAAVDLRSPIPLEEPLDAESAATTPARVHLISLDPASAEAIGDNPLDPVHRRPALEAGIAQAAGELAAVRTFWDQ